MFTDEKQSVESTIQQDEVLAKERRAKLKKTRSEAMALTAKERAQSKRGPGRPKGSRNKFSIARDEARRALDQQKLAIKVEVMREPKQILLESANYFWARAQFLSDHARKLAREDVSAASIDAIMEEADRQMHFAAKCAEMAAPYYHPRVSNVSEVDGAVVSYVARIPTPLSK